MALTQISTDGIKNGTITGSDLATNVDLVDNQRIRFGAGNDLQIFHHNDNSFINDTGTGQLMIQASGLRLRNYPEGHTQVNCQDDVVELYYNNSKVFETTSYGAKWTGILLGADNQQLQLGSSGDLQLYHDGTNSYIDNANTGILRIRGGAGGSGRDIQIQAKNGEYSINALPDGAVELYHDNSKKFETTSAGATVTGGLTTTGNIDAGTANFLTDDNGKFISGTAGDLQIYHDGTDNLISTSGTVLAVHRATTNASNPVFEVRSNHGATNQIKFQVDGDGDVLIPTDTGRLQLGVGSDLQIYHDGTNSVINNTTNDLRIESDRIELNNQASNEFYLTCTANGAVELYYDNSKKFETDSNGFYSTNYGDYIGVTSNGQTASGRFGYHENYKLYIENVRGTHTKILLDNDGKIRSQISDGSNLQDRFEVNASGAKLSGDFVPDADGTRDLGSNSYRWDRIYADTIQTLDSVAATQTNAEFRNTHSVYGGGVRFKSNNTYGTLELTNTDASAAATLVNTTGGWHWSHNLILGQDIAFNGETADANALDDYEEGSLSWELAKSGTPSLGTDNGSNVKYVKVGRLVHISGRIRTDSCGSAGNDTFVFQSGSTLPFTPETSGTSVVGHWRSQDQTDSSLTASIAWVGGSTTLYLYTIDAKNDYAADSNNVPADSQTNLVITFSLTYRANS